MTATRHIDRPQSARPHTSTPISTSKTSARKARGAHTETRTTPQPILWGQAAPPNAAALAAAAAAATAAVAAVANVRGGVRKAGSLNKGGSEPGNKGKRGGSYAQLFDFKNPNSCRRVGVDPSGEGKKNHCGSTANPPSTPGQGSAAEAGTFTAAKVASGVASMDRTSKPSGEEVRQVHKLRGERESNK